MTEFVERRKVTRPDLNQEPKTTLEAFINLRAAFKNLGFSIARELKIYQALGVANQAFKKIGRVK